MIVLSLAEFASKRRKAQDDAIATLQPLVDAWLKTPNPDTRRALVDAAVSIYTETYRAEGGTGTPLPGRFRLAVRTTLLRSNPQTDPVTLATLLAVTATNAATVQAAADDSEPLLMEWVTMHDDKVRHTHRDVEGQQRPPGEKFAVGGERLDYPGQPVGDPSIWINCRCTLAPVLASEQRSVTDVLADEGVAMTDTATEAPAAPATEMPPEIAATVPWHGVLAPEDKWSGDGRKFAANSLTTRDMPLPLTWQKASSEGHGGSVVVARIDAVERVDGEMRAIGEFLASAEADEVVGMIAEFGRFGVSVDADDAEFEFEEATGKVTFTSARIASASIVSIPAFAEAWVSLGTAPPDFMPAADTEDCDPTDPDGDCYDPKASAEATGEDIVRALTEAIEESREVSTEERKGLADKGHAMPDGSYPIANCGDLKNAIQAIGRAKDPAATKAHIKKRASSLSCPDVELPEGWVAEADEFGRGPGWITNPEDTRRIHDYWTKPGQEGYAKINWGVPGDFNRCRVEVGEEIAENSPDKVRFLNQICAQWHHDALGFWPGHAPTEQRLGDPAPALSLVAAGGPKAPAAWFTNPELSEPTHLTVTDDGRVFGHIAEWTTCHIGYPGVCVTAPHSETDYAYYASKSVLLDDGSMARTGVISLGAGHADHQLGVRGAVAHYDSTSAAVADVSVGEDEWGIWCAGWIRPGTTDEQVIALRASDVSGDWREVAGHQEMVAALAVNVAGLPVARVHDGVQVALVAAGVVAKPSINDPVGDLAEAIMARLDARDERRKRMRELATRVGGQ
jgi:hypothetical protein